MDQNEKLVMYGAVHVVAVDGYSRKVVGFATMPRKTQLQFTVLLCDRCYLMGFGTN